MRCSIDRVDYIVASDKVVIRMTAGRENPQFNTGYIYNSHSQRLLSLTEMEDSKILYVGLVESSSIISEYCFRYVKNIKHHRISQRKIKLKTTDLQVI